MNAEQSTKKVLILIPCSDRKKGTDSGGEFIQPLEGIQELRYELVEQLKNREPLNPNAPEIQAVNLYTGRLYEKAREQLHEVMSSPSIRVLIVSAFYGLAQLGEGLRQYDLEMSDVLYNRKKVGDFWSAKLPEVLQRYIEKEGITRVWSCLPNRYHEVFNEFWEHKTVECLRVIPKNKKGKRLRIASLGKLGEWLKIVLENPSYLTQSPPKPPEVENCVFEYIPC